MNELSEVYVDDEIKFKLKRLFSNMLSLSTQCLKSYPCALKQPKVNFVVEILGQNFLAGIVAKDRLGGLRETFRDYLGERCLVSLDDEGNPKLKM